MPRRSWRDLDRPERPIDRPIDRAAVRPASPAAQQATAGRPDDLARAASLAPDSRLSQLMQERQALEDRLRNLTGLPGQQGSGDPHRDARFQVPTFAQRQAEIRQWEAQRQAQLAQGPQQAQARWGQQMQAQPQGLPPLPGTLPATGLGATGLSPGVSDRIRAQRTAFTNRTRTAREGLLDRPRAVAEQVDSIGRPLRQLGNQFAQQDAKLDEMDRKLAAEGVSQSERDEIRRSVSNPDVNKAAKVLQRANAALEAPKKAVAKIDQFWKRREQQISGPMDRFSGYAADRERRLSTETGGSGDLFERMQTNRQSALRNRQQARMRDRADERRRERARERAAARRAED
ncbi:hypothetical protein [Sagittula sp. S175]|uniref:hypothetical protein n=1 Tax=Sagittula sp. S175 TaxID=3415129 RepID=UPI003C7A4366